MKKIIFVAAGAVVLSSSLNPKILFAQQDDFNTRVIQDRIYSMHLYRDKLLSDKYRPTYHFAVPEGIAHPFDPNGAIYWNGRYHLFYIFQPVKPRKGHRGDCWAHISSHDLVHWRFHPTALKPEPDDPEVAIYSGNAFINKEGVPTIMYQGLGAGNCIATCTDDQLNHWEKAELNPVIPYPEFEQDLDGAVYRSILEKLPEYGKYDVWDPHAWLEGDTYYSISGDNDLWPGRKTTLWKSRDLKNWKLVGDFFHHGGEEGHLDCPDFFKLGDKYVLLYLDEDLEYYIGDFKNEQFYPEKHGTMTWGSGVGYAPDESEHTTIVYDSRKNVISIDLSRTSLDRSLMEWFYKEHYFKQEAKYKLKPNESLNLHIFLDRSVMEVFVNNHLCLTHRIYSTRDDSKGIVLFSKGGSIKIPVLHAWRMHPSNPW